MASGKKGKKTKMKAIPLTDFFQGAAGGLPTQPIRKSTNWADEVDDYDAAESKVMNIVLPTAPKASRDYEDIASKVPKEPPFMAYLSNLPYDVDEEDIAEFFKNMKIASMRIPKDDRSGDAPKVKGFGYVQFEDRESLMSALIIPDTTLKNRRIRIEVAANADNDKRRGRMGDRMGGDTGGDWRSSNRPESHEDRRGGSGFGRDRDGGSGREFTREGMRESGRDRDYGGFSRDRDGGSNRDRDFGRDRDGGFNRTRDQDDRPGGWRDGDRPNNFNDKDRGYSRGNYRDSDRSRYDNYDREDRRGGGFRRYDDNERNGGFTSSSNRGDRDDRDSEAPSAESRQRPKLNLAPRTKPLEQSTVKPEPAVPSASIFGSAKPVDTTERERQIEEKLLREQEERLASFKDSAEDSSERKNFERGRPLVRRDDRDKDTSNSNTEANTEDPGSPARQKRNASEDDNRRSENLRRDHKSPEHKRSEKQDKPKREEKEKWDRPEKEMPKFQEPEAPNFQASNKFALLEEGSD